MRSRKENLARLRNAHHEIEPGQRFEVKDFDAGDAQGIAALFYAVYGENFPVDYVYDPEQIIQANASHQTNHIVGRTKSGEVVGLHALFRNPPGKHIMEVGSWIVLPAYRNTSLAMRLAQRTLGEPPAHLQLHVMYTQSVCDHLISQKVTEKYKFISCALELEAMPPRPGAAQGGIEERVTLLDEFMMLHDVPHAVRLPPAYADALQQIYTSRGLSREFVEDGQPQSKSRCSVESIDTASFVRMTISDIGRDIATHLARLERDYHDRHVLQLVIPLWQSGVSLAVEAARKAGLFLGGLLPLWADQDMLLMQQLRTTPDYSKVQLHTQEAKNLLDLIAADRASLNT